MHGWALPPLTSIAAYQCALLPAERRPDPIPAGNPKEKPSERPDEQREAPPPKTDTAS